jgi:hypothetical protein
MIPRVFDYKLFGLRVRSEIELPELLAGTGSDDPDVRIRLRPIDEAPLEGGLHVLDDGLLFVAPEVARYKVVGGREILVAPDAEVPDRNVRVFLLGSAFGALLHQRGMLPLHANAVEIDGKAVAFMGESGAGKSTLAAWFHDRGFRIIADDVCVVQIDENGRLRALPGIPRLRLWAEALTASGRTPSAYERSYLGAADLDKYDVPTAKRAAAESLELAAIYVLERGKTINIAPLNGVTAAEAIFAHTYRGAFAGPANTLIDQWSNTANVLRGTPIFAAYRPWDLDRFDSVCEQLAEHARVLVAASRTEGL